MLWTYSNSERQVGSSPRWFTCAAMWTTHINIQSLLSCGLHDWFHLDILKSHRLQIQAWKLKGDTAWLYGWSVRWWALHVCTSCGGCSLPSVRKGIAGASQPWPAGLSCPQEAGEQGAVARLHLQIVNLASTRTDTTIIVIKGARSNLFIYWFPTGSDRANWARCTFLYVCTGKPEHMTWMLCTTNIWWDIHSYGENIRGCHE